MSGIQHEGKATPQVRKKDQEKITTGERLLLVPEGPTEVADDYGIPLPSDPGRGCELLPEAKTEEGERKSE